MEKIIRKSVKDSQPQNDFTHQLVTLDDLNHFKQQLINELLAIFKTQSIMPPPKWMKSHEVRKLLKISPGTLQSFKSTGVIPHTKMGGITFYNYADIQQVLEAGKVQGNLSTSD